jgi:hypothetical protein
MVYFIKFQIVPIFVFVISCVMCMYLFIYCAVTPFFIYRIVSCMYNEYTVSIFRFLKLFLHDSKCFSPAVYLNALFFGEQKFL